MSASPYRRASRVQCRMGRISATEIETQRGTDISEYIELFEDFLAASSTTLPAWLGTQDTSAAGSPTLDYVNDAENGEFQLLTDATDEAQNLTLYGGDNLTIDPTQYALFECRLKIDADAIPWSADQRFVAGLAAARNATLDSNTHHAWFKMDGASANLLWETDDATTDDNDNDTGVDLADNTYLWLKIELNPPGQAGEAVFWVKTGVGLAWSAVGVGDISAAAATDLLQPYIEMQKDGGTETEDMRIDYIRVVSAR